MVACASCIGQSGPGLRPGDGGAGHLDRLQDGAAQARLALEIRCPRSSRIVLLHTLQPRDAGSECELSSAACAFRICRHLPAWLAGWVGGWGGALASTTPSGVRGGTRAARGTAVTRAFPSLAIHTRRHAASRTGPDRGRPGHGRRWGHETRPAASAPRGTCGRLRSCPPSSSDCRSTSRCRSWSAPSGEA